MTFDRAAYFAERGHPPESEDRVCIDFDGTLYPRVGIYDFPDPEPGAVEAVKRLKARGFHITIWTSRLWPEWLEEAKYVESEMREYVETLLKRDDIPYDRLVGKPPAAWYVDDIAVRYRTGEWPAISDWVLWASES
jgi:hypothetical protein